MHKKSTFSGAFFITFLYFDVLTIRRMMFGFGLFLSRLSFYRVNRAAEVAEHVYFIVIPRAEELVIKPHTGHERGSGRGKILRAVGHGEKFVRRAQDKPVGVKLNRHNMLYKSSEALYEKALALAGKMIFRLGVKIVYAKRVRAFGGCAELLKMSDDVLFSVARRDLPMHLIILALVKAIKPAELERSAMSFVKLYLAAQLL